MTNGSLSPAQVTAFHQQGFIVAHGLIEPEIVRFGQQTIDDFIREHPDDVGYEPAVLKNRDPHQLSPDERLLAVRGIHQRVYRDERFPELAGHTPLLKALVSLLGDDIKVLQDMALIKPPRIGSEKPAHQDAAYFEVEPLDQIVGTWWALDRASLENGCMCVRPGTQRLPVVEHTAMEGTPHLVIPSALLDPAHQVALPMEPGDVLLFSSRLFHYTPPNRSDQRRRALQIHYASAHCRLTAGRKPRPYTLVHGATQPQGI